MKEKLTGALGTVGVIIYYIVACILLLMPLHVLRFPWWIDLLLIALIYWTSYIGAILELVLWGWSFFLVIQDPIGIFQIVYYVALIIYIITGLIRNIRACVSNLVSRNRNKAL